MKVKIEEGCIACGACESVCDEVFSVEDTVKVNDDKIAGNEDCVKEAAEACPVNVIIVEEQFKLYIFRVIKGHLFLSKCLFCGYIYLSLVR